MHAGHEDVRAACADAEALLRAGRTSAARKAARAALYTDGPDPCLYAVLGRAHAAEGAGDHADRAEAVFQEGLAAFPDDLGLLTAYCALCGTDDDAGRTGRVPELTARIRELTPPGTGPVPPAPVLPVPVPAPVESPVPVASPVPPEPVPTGPAPASSAPVPSASTGPAPAPAAPATPASTGPAPAPSAPVPPAPPEPPASVVSSGPVPPAPVTPAWAVRPAPREVSGTPANSAPSAPSTPQAPALAPGPGPVVTAQELPSANRVQRHDARLVLTVIGHPAGAAQRAWEQTRARPGDDRVAVLAETLSALARRGRAPLRLLITSPLTGVVGCWAWFVVLLLAVAVLHLPAWTGLAALLGPALFPVLYGVLRGARHRAARRLPTDPGPEPLRGAFPALPVVPPYTGREKGAAVGVLVVVGVTLGVVARDFPWG
ncbi:hypothetical protein [Streptomyces sp. NPDC048111]|uniref:hypothetical protein n=1 Tax=Streptomyces sp. NPDC048111 TaxID=3365500 RepID=UPI0037113D57